MLIFGSLPWINTHKQCYNNLSWTKTITTNNQWYFVQGSLPWTQNHKTQIANQRSTTWKKQEHSRTLYSPRRLIYPLPTLARLASLQAFTVGRLISGGLRCTFRVLGNKPWIFLFREIFRMTWIVWEVVDLLPLSSCFPWSTNTRSALSSWHTLWSRGFSKLLQQVPARLRSWGGRVREDRVVAFIPWK